MKPKNLKKLHNLDDAICEKETQLRAMRQELAKVMEKIRKECWQPDMVKATPFFCKVEAQRFATDLVYDHGYERVFAVAFYQYHVVMIVEEKGILYYTETESLSED